MGRGHDGEAFLSHGKDHHPHCGAGMFRALQQNGLHVKTIVLTAKDKICFMRQGEAAKEEAECNPEACPYADGHFDRINDAMYDLLTHEENFTRETVQAYAAKHQVCPFELSL